MSGSPGTKAPAAPGASSPTAHAGVDVMRVKTAVFEGPVDLLLTLALRQQVDLSQVRLGDLAWDYLNSIRSEDGGRARTPEEMAAFLVVASRLLALKAAGLLPGAAGDGEEEDLEAWEETVRQRMAEYQRFKEAATELMRRHQEGGFSFPSAIEGEIVPSERLEISRDGLAAAFQAILDRLPAPIDVEVELSSYSLADEMDGIRARLIGDSAVSFTVFFEAAQTRLHAVVIFLALLELIRLGEARFRQRATFGEIELLRGVEGA
ncbi:MAG TPA: segregation/condensation protein A [Candidatus Dormibacteraeota bacterium]|nr:segregation/condensation protein A [Candidatus Dormibacteraeota bacterium]